MGKICIGHLTNENGSLAIFYLEQENQSHYDISMDAWSVEICKNVILVFTTQVLDAEQLRKCAYRVCEQVLDLLALRRRVYISVENPEWRYILCYQKDGLSVMEIHDRTLFPIGVISEIKELPDSSCQISMRISFGNNAEEPVPIQNYMEMQWRPIFRYYRMACLSHNLYDGYRWMYLVFEQLLQLVEPIKRNTQQKICEKEHTWLQRALEKLECEFHVFQKLYGQEDSSSQIARFIREQYKETRCRLFHAKGCAMVPNDDLDQQQLGLRYQELQFLCNAILNAMGILKSPYGVMTYQGFWKTMQKAWKGKRGFLCDRQMEELLEMPDKAVSKGKRAGIAFVGINEVKPGIVDMCFAQTYLQSEGEQRYISCGIELDNEPMMVGKLPMELSFTGDVCIKMHMVLQMLNKGEVVIV